MRKKVLLGVTGSVAAVLTPKLAAALIGAGHEVRIVATDPGLFFIPPNNLSFVDDPNNSSNPALGSSFYLELDEFGLEHLYIWRDKDEWPAGGYHKNDPVRHIEFRDWADVLLIAPLTANTLAKIATGVCDNFLTCIARAWVKGRPLVIAPAMNTEMWIDPITQIQINSLAFPISVSGHLRFDLHVVEPIEKRLACGDVGKGAMAKLDDIVSVVDHL
ncbi:MAG: flavoprotein [Patescibacteria group bacterium]